MMVDQHLVQQVPVAVDQVVPELQLHLLEMLLVVQELFMVFLVYLQLMLLVDLVLLCPMDLVVVLLELQALVMVVRAVLEILVEVLVVPVLSSSLTHHK
jgi:hypothetical protein